MRKFLWGLKWASSTFFLWMAYLLFDTWRCKHRTDSMIIPHRPHQGLQNDLLYQMYWQCWSKIMTSLGYFSSQILTWWWSVHVDSISSRKFVYYCVFLHIVWSISNLYSKLDNGLFIDLIDCFSFKAVS